MNKKEFMNINVEESTKASLITALEGIPATVKDENLIERVNYTLGQAKKSIKKVTLADLKELVSEAQAFLSTPKTETSKKPALSKKKDKPAEKVETETVVESKPEKSKKTLKKVVTAPQRSPKASNLLPVAMMFPEELEIEAEDGKKTLVRVHEKYHTFDEIREAIANGKTLLIAAYWTKAHIKKYAYSQMFMLLNGGMSSFPNDLDILNVVVACETMDRVFAMSTYTEALYKFDKPDFEPVEDENPKDGSKFTVRVSNGMEFEVYEVADEDTEE